MGWELKLAWDTRRSNRRGCSWLPRITRMATRLWWRSKEPPGFLIQVLVTYRLTLDGSCIEKSHQIIVGMMMVAVMRSAAAVAARPALVR
jgi:hypothetical protein